MMKALKLIELVDRRRYLDEQFVKLQMESDNLHRIIKEKEDKGLLALDETRELINVLNRLSRTYEQSLDIIDQIIELNG